MKDSFIARYDAGDRAGVWADLHALGTLTEHPPVVRAAANLVCTRAMERAAFNVIAIHKHLVDVGFSFAYPNEAYVPPDQETELERSLASSVGALPLTLQAWLRQVGFVCFRRKLQTSLPDSNPDVLDPLEFQYSLGALNEDLDWRRERIDGGELDTGFSFAFAGDLYHKNDISGGGQSYISLPSDTIDAMVVEDDCGRVVERSRLEGRPLEWQDARALQGNCDRQIWFVDYLREYFEGGGFRRLTSNDDVSKNRLSELVGNLVEV